MSAERSNADEHRPPSLTVTPGNSPSFLTAGVGWRDDDELGVGPLEAHQGQRARAESTCIPGWIVVHPADEADVSRS